MEQTEIDTLRESIAATIRATDDIDLLRELLRLLRDLSAAEEKGGDPRIISAKGGGFQPY